MATVGANVRPNIQNVEESELPLLCPPCLGNNPNLRMIKEKHKKDCKICNRPFVVLKWSPGPRMRLKKIEVCEPCGAEKNICQACLRDLDNIQPVPYRDPALRKQDFITKSDEEFQNLAREIESGDGTKPAGVIAAKSKTRTLLYPKVRSHTKIAEEYPVGHDKPTYPDDPIPDQNIKSRPSGFNEPVDKALKRYHEMPKLEPPEDKTITKLFVGGLGDKVDADDLEKAFELYGEIKSVEMEPKQQCGFVEFTDRASAEIAAEKSFCKLIINGQRLGIKWVRSLTAKKRDENDEEMSELQPGPSRGKQRPLEDIESNYFNLPSEQMMPPSMQKRGPMSIKGNLPKGDFSMRQGIGMDRDDEPYEPHPYQSGMKMQASHQPHQSYTQSRGSASHSRESGGKVKPFGANLNVPSQNPNRKGPKH